MSTQKTDTQTNPLPFDKNGDDILPGSIVRHRGDIHRVLAVAPGSIYIGKNDRGEEIWRDGEIFKLVCGPDGIRWADEEPDEEEATR